MSYHNVPVALYDNSFATMSPEAQLVELYIRTCRHRATEGLFRLPPGYVEEDLGMERALVEAAIAEVIEHREFLYDWAAGVVLDKQALRFNPLGRRGDPDTWDRSRAPDKRLASAIRKLQELPPTPLLKHLLVLADRYSRELADLMRETFDFPEADTDAYNAIESSEAPYRQGRSPLPSPLSISRKPREEQSSEEESGGRGSLRRR